MSIKQGRHLLKQQGFLFLSHLGIGLLLGFINIATAKADRLALQAIEAVSLAGNKLQIQLKMDGDAITPQVFQTDNPARIVMDFTNLRNDLHKKIVPINTGGATDITIMEAGIKTRLIVNLLRAAPYQTEVKGNQVLLTLAANTANAARQPVLITPNEEAPTVSKYLPRQDISGVDFRRGDKGEGRIIIGLANANTIIDAKETGGKVLVNFLNTTLPPSMVKRLDVADFATPVKTIDMQSRGVNTVLTITPVNGNYEYSSFQADGTLTLEFRPLTPEEKVAQEKQGRRIR